MCTLATTIHWNMWRQWEVCERECVWVSKIWQWESVCERVSNFFFSKLRMCVNSNTHVHIQRHTCNSPQDRHFSEFSTAELPDLVQLISVAYILQYIHTHTYIQKKHNVTTRTHTTLPHVHTNKKQRHHTHTHAQVRTHGDTITSNWNFVTTSAKPGREKRIESEREMRVKRNKVEISRQNYW